MRKLKIRKSLLFFTAIAIVGCKTFLEQDISNQTIVLLSPLKGTETEIASQTFWWEKVDGANNYRLQIVSPSFDLTEVLILDTLVATDKFTVNLYPSVLEWRVRAENSVYQTNWAVNKLKIYSTSDLTRQKVNLLSPGTVTNSKNIRFEWDGLYNAKNYSFVAYKEKWEDNLEVTPTMIDTTFFMKEFGDGKYVWGVKAKNLTSETLYTQKSLIVDTTPPSMPVLSSPSDSLIVTTTMVEFTWSSSDKTSGIAQDTLNIFSDKSLTKLVKSVITNSKNAEISFANRSVYYWTVRSVDNAGNVGKKSDPFIFTIK